MKIRSPISQLGRLIKAHRESINISQKELVDRLNVKTNRTTIAHLEQGLRLPVPSILREICEYLNIPKQLWSAFEQPNIRKRINAGPEFLIAGTNQSIVSVSGIMGSGKTTLARIISASLGYKYISESKIALKYLKDLSNDPKRWAFETQLAFLSHKAFEIIRNIENGNRIITDRTLSEDSNIFAKYFKYTNAIDERSYETYIALADYFINHLPPPDIIIHCKCSIETAFKRINDRSRGDADIHTIDHLSKINELYDLWLSSYEDSTIYEINSEKWDWTDLKIQQQIIREFESICMEEDKNTEQLSLFRESKKTTINNELYAFELLKLNKRDDRYDRKLNPIGLEPLPFPSAYIAAPFTAIASDSKEESSDLFKIELPHGKIKKGKFRNALLSIEKSLSNYGITSLIPHRDVNHWGSRILSATNVTNMCTEQVVQSDIFVGLLGESHGAHYELGIALGMNKPCVIIHCKEVKESFISTGFNITNKSLYIIQCEKLNQINLHLESEDFKNYISKYI